MVQNGEAVDVQILEDEKALSISLLSQNKFPVLKLQLYCLHVSQQ